MRIVSLLPSATEIVYALGLEADLVGVTFECDEPARARTDKAVVVGGLDTAGMTPRQIDDHVRAKVAAGEDLYTLHADALAGLDPDLVITQDLCRVCALPAGHVEAALTHLGCCAEVLSLDPHRLTEVLDTLVAVGERTDRSDAAKALREDLQRRLDAIGEPARRPTVAVVEWVDPPYAAGHWVPDLVTAAGGTPTTEPGLRSVETRWDAVAAEIVIVAPCGYGLDDAAAQAESLQTDGLAIEAREVWAIDGGGLVVRPGPRLVDGVEAIASVLHGDGSHPGVRRIR